MLSIGRRLPVLALFTVIIGCSALNSDLPRDKWVQLEAKHMKLQFNDPAIKERIAPTKETYEVLVSTNQGARSYYEQSNWGGSGTDLRLRLRMLPKGWRWRAQQSAKNLQKEIRETIGGGFSNISINSVSVVETSFARSFFGRFRDDGYRDCAGMLFATTVEGLSIHFRNMIIGVVCSIRELKDSEIKALMRAITVTDLNYTGEGYTEAQATYLRSNLTGVSADFPQKMLAEVKWSGENYTDLPVTIKGYGQQKGEFSVTVPNHGDCKGVFDAKTWRWTATCTEGPSATGSYFTFGPQNSWIRGTGADKNQEIVNFLIQPAT